MRFLMIMYPDRIAESMAAPPADGVAEMMKYNEQLVKAGVMLAGEGLHPSSKGVRVKFSGDKRIVTDGPFAETKELIAGYWLWQCASLEDAIAWAKRVPLEGETQIEIRRLFEAEDFGAEFTPDLRAKEEALRSRIETRH